MRFLVHYEGAGEGCDYTIGCNHALRSIEAVSAAKALKKVMDELIGYQGRYDDGPYEPKSLSAVTVYTLAEPDIADTMSFDLEKICIVRQAKLDAAAAKTQEDKDRALYETLKARYGTGEVYSDQDRDASV